MNRPGQPNLLGAALIGALFGWGAWKTQGWTHPNDRLIHWVLLGLVAYCALIFVWLLLVLCYRLIRRRMLMKPTDKSGTARWANHRDIRKAKLYKRRGVLAGLKDKRPVWVDIESSGLVLCPSGGGKTVNFVVPALCADPSSMLVPDLKCTLGPMTAKLRRKKHKHRTLCVNPGGVYQNLVGPSARYNPLQILVDSWQNPALHHQL